MHRPVDDKSDLDSQSQTASLVFPGYHFPTDHRYIIFTVATMWQHDITTLPAEFAPAAHHLELLNSALQSAYCATYEHFMDGDTGLISSIAKLASDDPSVSRVTIHQAFQDKLQDVRDAVRHCKITYLPSIVPILKRKGMTDQTVGKKPRQVSTTGRAG
jgi:hypothetical protein